MIQLSGYPTKYPKWFSLPTLPNQSWMTGSSHPNQTQGPYYTPPALMLPPPPIQPPPVHGAIFMVRTKILH